MNIELSLRAVEYELGIAHQIMKEAKEPLPKQVTDSFTSAVYMRTWQYFGRKTFMIADRLLEYLWYTDVPKDFHFSQLKFPFSSFCLLNDNGLIRNNKIRNPNCDNMSDNYTHIFFISASDLAEYHHHVLESKGIHFIRSHDFTIMPVSADQEHELRYDFIFMPFNHDTYFKDAWTKDKANYQFDDMKSVMNLCINALLYINDPTRSAESEEMRVRSELTDSTKKGKNRFTRYDFVYLKPPKNVSLSRDGTGKPIDKRFIVRGHWRNQAMGPKRKERKLIWIRPYMKGQSMAEIVNKTYKVE